MFSALAASLAALAFVSLLSRCGGPASPTGARNYFEVTVAGETLRAPNTPCEINVDFAGILIKKGIEGSFDPRSVYVEGRNPAAGKYFPVDFRLSEDFKYKNEGRLYWLVPTPEMTDFRVWFDARTSRRPGPADYVPAIGLGDEIMFNTDESSHFFAMSAPLLVDYDGDGTTDVLAVNHYSDRFGAPYDGILCHPGIEENGNGILTGDFFRLHYVPEGKSLSEAVPLHARYNWVSAVDWDEDGLTDILYMTIEQSEPELRSLPENAGIFISAKFVTFLKNTGIKDAGGLPILREAARYPSEELTRGAYVPSIACVDLDGDGTKDLAGVRTSPDGDVRVVTVFFFKNKGNDARGLPALEPPAPLGTAGGEPLKATQNAHLVSFGDVNGDGRIDIIGNDLSPTQTYWFENMGGSPPVFKDKQILPALPDELKGYRWVRWRLGEGLLGLSNSILMLRTLHGSGFSFDPAGTLRETRGPLRGGSQEKPEWIDWDDDGDQDLVAGEFTGLIHLYENIGTPSRPRFRPPVCVEAQGEPIRVYRDGVFGGKHWHGMAGYPSIACVDWDKDGLFDLIVPNETNRVFWYRNAGERGKPRFGERRQILPDGFSDSDEKLERTRRLAGDRTVPNHPYPLEEDIPFFWRSRPAVADYTGDGLEDIIALNGMKDLVLYERYRSPEGSLGLGNGAPLFYDDGGPVQKPRFFKLREVDWDEDGLMDIVATQNLFSADQRSLLFLRNVGTKRKPVFARPEAIKLWGEAIRYSAHGLQPSFVDWEGDGSLDFVGCSESGFFVLFRRAALTHPKPLAAVAK